MPLDQTRLRRIAERLREKKDLQDRLNEIKRELRRVVPDAIEEMAQEGVRSQTFTGVGNLHMKKDHRAKYHPDFAPDDDANDEEKMEARFRLMQALDEAGLGEYARRSIDWQGLTARLKEMDAEGEELPEELDGILEFRKGWTLALNSSGARNRDVPTEVKA